MKLAIMQPCFFPYMGYWQLLGAVDRFVIYVDVNYIKGGWINRNRILINGKPSCITVPLYQASRNKRICDVSLQPSQFWRRKLIRSIENTYRKSPFFCEHFPLTGKMEIGVAGISRHLNEFDLLGKYAPAEYKQGARNV